jgi:hypothetical protein
VVRRCDLSSNMEVQTGTWPSEMCLCTAIEMLENSVSFARRNRTAAIPDADSYRFRLRVQADYGCGIRPRVLDGVIRKLCHRES